jgi:ABC-type branched-subunit amino acid transport system substrate-binding protein
MTNKKVAVFASDEPDGQGWYSLFPKVLKDAGYDVVGINKKLGLLPMETTDFSTVISQWKAANVQILWGNAPGPFFGAMWKQAREMGFSPKIVSIGRAPLFYTDVNSWGDDLPEGIGVEIWWDPSWQDSPGIGGTTPQSLAERWTTTTGRPLDPGIGWGYQIIQVLADAIERAGTLDGAKVNEALASTDIKTIAGRVKFDDEHYNHKPLVFGQWQKSDKPEKWVLPIVYSNMPAVPTTGKYVFPIPYGK